MYRNKHIFLEGRIIAHLRMSPHVAHRMVWRMHLASNGRHPATPIILS
jgi:hypothetical protein